MVKPAAPEAAKQREGRRVEILLVDGQMANQRAPFRPPCRPACVQSASSGRCVAPAPACDLFRHAASQPLEAIHRCRHVHCFNLHRRGARPCFQYESVAELRFNLEKFGVAEQLPEIHVAPVATGFVGVMAGDPRMGRSPIAAQLIAVDVFQPQRAAYQQRCVDAKTMMWNHRRQSAVSGVTPCPMKSAKSLTANRLPRMLATREPGRAPGHLRERGHRNELAGIGKVDKPVSITDRKAKQDPRLSPAVAGKMPRRVV